MGDNLLQFLIDRIKNPSKITLSIPEKDKRIYEAVKVIMELKETQQMYLRHLVFHYEQYNETSNPKFAQHFMSLETDEK